MHPYLNIAIKAARKAGDIIVRAQQDLNKLMVREKGPYDFVSETDQKAEGRIIDIIRESYPEHSILGEETGLHENADASTVWVIDPIDGTQNFIKGLPFFAVSIAIKEQGKLSHAVVYDPMRQELFTASRGKGAFLDSTRIRVSDKRSLTGTLLGTGMPHYQKANWADCNQQLNRIFPEVADLRFLGSAALALAYVAAGRLDGYWETGLQEWDMAGGALLVKEAGGLVSDFKGQEDFLSRGEIVAGSPKVLKGLLTIINEKG